MTFLPAIKTALSDIVGAQWVKDDPVTLYSYRCDGMALRTGMPMGVVFPACTAEVAAVARCLHDAGISFLPRGAGTGISGGAVPDEGSVVVEMGRFRTIEELDPLNRTITVGPGVVNLDISKAARPMGLYFVPDPSSQKACSIGGNVGENAGGPHTLKYGVTVNHVLGLEVVLPAGEVVTLGGPVWGTPGPDVLGLFIGSEGTLGIVTKVICRLTPIAEKVTTMLAAFDSVAAACHAVSAIIAAGIVPAALEMIDKIVIDAVEKTIKPGFPRDAEAVLIIETEDLTDGLAEEAQQIRQIALSHGASQVSTAANEAERALIWRARKEALGAIGHIAPSYYTQDGVIPRSALPRVLTQIQAIGKAHGLTIANVFHAGDGNLHPLILYDSTNEREIQATHEAGSEILEVCLAEGGTLSGEHGIGLEKANLFDKVYNAADIAHMRLIHATFNPRGLLNPGKIFPTPGRCSEVRFVKTKTGIQV